MISKPTALLAPVQKRANAMDDHASGRRTIGPLVMLVGVVGAAVLVTHWPALAAKAMACDDKQYLVDNYLVRNPSWSSAGRLLGEVLEPSTVKGYYQPLSMISLMIDHALGGRSDNLFPFHRTSLILHVANTLLVITLLYLLFHQPWPAAVVGLLFGLHPLTVEPIPWVGERKTLLAAFFALLSLIFYVRYARTGRVRFFVGAILAYVLALLSKPTSTPLPLAMLLLDYWPLNRLTRRAVFEKLPLLAVGAASAVITFISQNRTAATVLPTEVPLLHAPLRLCHNVVFYLEKIVWPANLSSHYALPQPFDLSDRGLLFGVIGVLILLPALALSLRYTRAPAAGVAIYFFMLLPTVQIVGFSDAIAADKYVYLPSIGILITLAWFLGRLPVFASQTSWRPTVVLVELVVIFAAAGEAVAARRYLAYWKDTPTLCAHILSLTLQAAGVHNHLGLYLADQGNLNEAIAEYQEALTYDPNYVEARNNLGIAYSEQGKTTEAVSCWTQTLQKNPNNFTAAYNLGTWFAERGQGREARRYLEVALRLGPNDPKAHTNLATVLSQEGRLDEAISHLRQSVALWPNSANAQHNLAVLLLRSGRFEEAIRHYSEVVRLTPNSADAHCNLAEAMLQARRTEEAAREFREALRLDPAHDGARAGLQSLAAQTASQPK